MYDFLLSEGGYSQPPECISLWNFIQVIERMPRNFCITFKKKEI
jgi:hypothetical protein